jgi:hypothetical protein
MCETTNNEDGDYMSDAFLQCGEAEKDSKKRKSKFVNLLSKKKVDALMSATIEVGMNHPIEKTNKGYKLLEKFGYKESSNVLHTISNPNATTGASGSSLHEVNGGATIKPDITPLRVVMRDPTFKGGVGTQEVVVGANNSLAATICNRNLSQETDSEARLRGQFLSDQALKLKLREEASLLRRVKLLAYELDYKLNPLEAGEAGPGEEGSLHNLRLEELQMQVDGVIEHLRSIHNYCVHCGCQFDSGDDLALSCPGPALDDH